MKLSSLPKVGIEVIRGEELRDRGFGGIWGTFSVSLATITTAICSGAEWTRTVELGR